MPKLINNAAVTSGPVQWLGGSGVFRASGTFGGATVKLQYLQDDGATWSDMGPDTSLTAPGGGGFTYTVGMIRALVSGGAPSGLYVSAEELR
jgi:hypothetical protein